jgi:hypothetical protein
VQELAVAEHVVIVSEAGVVHEELQDPPLVRVHAAHRFNRLDEIG